MSATPSGAPADDRNPTGVYLFVVVVEVLVISALYWLGRHFG